jgi:tetratricopeptide (TPR) repeat protein
MSLNTNSNHDNASQESHEHQEVGAEKPDPTTRISFFKDLVSRRVPHILGGYLAASWIVLEFMDWLVRRYPISPHLVEFCLVVLAAMIPTVLLLAYFHGKPGPDKWTKVEKIGIPTNVLATATLLVFLFHGRDLGATTTTITLVDEQGQTFERSIPKSEFRKSVAIFSLENESGDTSLDWLSHALPDMILYDLLQDIYLEIRSTYNLYDDIRDAGFPEAVRIPMTMKRKIAEEKFMQYFAFGSINEQEGQLAIQLFLHDTRTTKLLAEKVLTGADMFKLVDEMSIWIKESVNIPKQHIEQTQDLPVSEILTSSIPAVKDFYGGNHLMVMEGDWIRGAILLEKSVQEDPAFAYAYLRLYIAYAFTNQGVKYRQSFAPLMQHLYKLPERLQFAVKHDYYYGIKREPQMALDVAENWAELYPDDMTAHKVLALLYMFRNQKDKELMEYKKMVGLDPGQYDLYLKIGDIYKDLGESDEALNYYQLYKDEFPNNTNSYRKMGDLYSTMGDYEQAKSNYREALLIEPDEISILRSMAQVDVELGNFSQALEAYHKILNDCKSAEEKFDTYDALEDYYYLRGQLDSSIEFTERKLAEMAHFAPPFMILNEQFNSLDKYILAGKEDVAFQVVHDAEEQLGPPLDGNIPFGYLSIYLTLEDVEKTEKALAAAEAAMESLQGEMARPVLLNAEGRIHELKQEYDLAIQRYNKHLILEPTEASIQVQLGRCYRMQQDYKKAEEHIKKALTIHPFWPDANYEMGLVYNGRGINKEALEYLQKAQSIWEEADSNYTPAIMARKKLAELETSGR